MSAVLPPQVRGACLRAATSASRAPARYVEGRRTLSMDRLGVEWQCYAVFVSYLRAAFLSPQCAYPSPRQRQPQRNGLTHRTTFHHTSSDPPAASSSSSSRSSRQRIMGRRRRLKSGAYVWVLWERRNIDG